jgi:hypothetical protein
MSEMIEILLLLAVANSPVPQQAEPAPDRSARFAPSSSVTARAIASVRIVSAVRFGEGRSEQAPGASLRAATLTDQSGQTRLAKLMEFQ